MIVFNHWHRLPADQVLRELKVHPETGLSPPEIDAKRTEYGKNEYEAKKQESLLHAVIRQFRDVSTLVLLFAMTLSLILAIRSGHGFLEPAVIGGIILLNLFLAISQERSAERSLEALAALSAPSCRVLRDGLQLEIPTVDVVVGDILILNMGDYVPADCRILESNNLTIDESSLTGESEAAEKDHRFLPDEDALLGDRRNMAYSGCLVTSGNGKAIVVATGMKSEMGKIAAHLNNTHRAMTPLQRRLDRVGKAISLVALVAGAALFALGLYRNEDIWSIMLLAVTLAVAAVPETLSLIVTLSLTRGVKNMVGKNSLVRKLPAVETLGSTSVICSDKTGTLTQNRMQVRALYLHGQGSFPSEHTLDPQQQNLLKMFALASSATMQRGEDGALSILGDPTETAILMLLAEKGFDKNELEQEFPKVAEIPFSSDRKMMTSIHRCPEGGYWVLTKGAMDRVPFAPMDEAARKAQQDAHDAFAAKALRVISLGYKQIEALPEVDDYTPLEADLDFVGLVGLIDPPRPEAVTAIERAKSAGIRTVMITGDHAATAAAIATELGILNPGEKVLTGTELLHMDADTLRDTVRDYSVYARVSPDDKIKIVKAWQEQGETVAMTGDGVNDAPALKAADVGIAMGQNGTEVAKSAADMVITDDNFATIIDAVEEGRNVYSNIKKTIYFLMVCNFSEIIAMLFAYVMNWGILVTPVMLLLINVLGDGIPGLQLSNEISDGRIMKKGPVGRAESFVAGGLLRHVIRQTLAMAAVTLAGFYVGAHLALSPAIVPSELVGQTMAFLVLGWTSILHVFNVRKRDTLLKPRVHKNPPLLISALVMLVVMTLIGLLPPLQYIFGTTALSGPHLLFAAMISFLPSVVCEIGKYIDNRSHGVTADDIAEQPEY